MNGFWSDDMVHRVGKNSSCDAYESDGLVVAYVDEARCESCFFHVDGGCHNAFTSGIKMAQLGVEVEGRICDECAHDDEGCLIALGEVETDLLKESQLKVEAYASSEVTGVCPGFEQKITASQDEEEEIDLDTALFMGGL